ncbi:Cysteine synthase, putative [Perkinsus marinus ATCC 50983]|uniref:Cysteine synthase 1 n=1 Tax=Perkinsus marinus (strain ATCC 50983 / TXsc) TaxID=423536 RepID=C5L3X3_PERM5|nr:Cysteine synthase, putative [Perkinsus marinus ATCC 50983]EER08702.1 Cysteine synthase, putative [Perkinsus marinus ATCC 50983]|eukprot:XP_002776886.1 Cysteine synthase, putative [Perkinsus marinus ATCC 50983]
MLPGQYIRPLLSISTGGIVASRSVYKDFTSLVGNTPMVELRHASRETGRTILGKCEFLNPGGSIKDRAAVWMLKDAEEKGLLVRGQPGTVIEATAGNTGIGLALAANSIGYRCIIVIPESQTEEKKAAIRQAGAKLIEVPAVPYRNPNNYVRVCSRMVENLRGQGHHVFFGQQFDNIANKKAHFEATGPEIWEQTGGLVDSFCCAMGTGGTLSGVSEYLNSKKETIHIGLTDPKGAMLYRWFTEGRLAASGSSITEGIGQARVTGNMVGLKPDSVHEIDDSEALKCLWQLMNEEGLSLGLSSGINVAGAMRLARMRPTGSVVVTVLCDTAQRYERKMFDEEYLKSQGLPPRPLAEHSIDDKDLSSALKAAFASEVEVKDALAAYEEAVPEELMSGKPLP